MKNVMIGLGEIGSDVLNSACRRFHTQIDGGVWVKTWKINLGVIEPTSPLVYDPIRAAIAEIIISTPQWFGGLSP